MNRIKRTRRRGRERVGKRGEKEKVKICHHGENAYTSVFISIHCDASERNPQIFIFQWHQIKQKATKQTKMDPILQNTIWEIAKWKWIVGIKFCGSFRLLVVCRSIMRERGGESVGEKIAWVKNNERICFPLNLRSKTKAIAERAYIVPWYCFDWIWVCYENAKCCVWKRKRYSKHFAFNQKQKMSRNEICDVRRRWTALRKTSYNIIYCARYTINELRFVFV